MDWTSFIAGTEAELLILPKDAFGNNVSSASEGPIPYNFILFASTLNGFPANILNITQKGWNQQGSLCIGFVAATAGRLLLHVQVENQTLDGPPLPFKVNPGKLDVHSCKAQWNIETKYFQLFTMMEGFIHQHDQYGNLVSGLYAFDIEVIEKGTNLSMPVADLLFKDISPGIQSFSFSLYEPGNFMLMISDKEKNTLISNMPHEFTIYIGAPHCPSSSPATATAYVYPSHLKAFAESTGYCDGTNSIVNGSGLNNSVAGSFSSGRLNYGLIDPVQIASAPVVDPKNNAILIGSLDWLSGCCGHLWHMRYVLHIMESDSYRALLGVNVYNSEYFPKAYNDTVSVWEDESIPFNVLENDYFAGGNASILEYSKYTPYKGFYGNDSFLYTIADINENCASGSVDLLILCRPPQFVSLPSSLDAVNFALQSIQYFGNENFYGGDTIRVSTINRNGRNDIDVPIYVQPINDPPVINIPSFVILDGMSDGVLIFGERRDKIDFIGDPDLLNFPGNRSSFLIMFSIEVSAGLLSTSLPAALIGSTELKLKTSYHWQPLQTFVTISKHFLVKAKGIRFRGTIDDCNSIMEHLSYHEGVHGAVLTVMVNDLANHGCYPNCAEMMSMCLFAESTVNLIRHRPMSSLAAHALGSAIVIESLAVFSLGLLLLFFICKCAAVLVHEKRRRKAQDFQLSKCKGSPTQNLAGDRSGNEKLHTGYCPLSFLFGGQHSNSQRSVHISATEEADEIMKNSPQSSTDQHEDVLPSDVVPSVSLEG
ncbi:UNVERIFIED_CONTAM: protein GAMETE EXPRESSED 2 [Sesamum radiatum]|uniref:Protein GAMETE EXPRESSED 2 n=1 Tax=Sesamum radiatum TaxID=300843 RepID=A0AAW2S8Q5_SESRA